jgi:hypothetical protein
MDRHSIIEGLYWYYANHHEGQGSASYIKLSFYSSMFKPGRMDRGPMSEDARDVYRKAWVREHGSPGMTECACCGLPEMGVPDMELCAWCSEAQCDPWGSGQACETEDHGESGIEPVKATPLLCATNRRVHHPYRNPVDASQYRFGIGGMCTTCGEGRGAPIHTAGPDLNPP